MEMQRARLIGPTLSGSLSYVSVISAGNGKLYAPPFRASQVLEIDPDTSNVSSIGVEIGGCQLRYSCIAEGSNGKLYAAPFGASKVLEIDPDTRNVNFIGLRMKSLFPGRRDTRWYSSIATGGNGKLYAVPFQASKVLEIDPENSDVRSIGEDLNSSYMCSVAGPDGKIYAVPSHGRKILAIDPETSTVRCIDIGFEGGDQVAYKSMVAAANGKLYAVPFNASKVLEIDPEASIVRSIGVVRNHGGNYACVVVGANGKLYAPPYLASKVLEIDPTTSSVRLIGDEIKGCGALYNCIVAAANGKLYAAPDRANQVLEIDPGDASIRFIGHEFEGDVCSEGHPKPDEGSWRPRYMCIAATSDEKCIAPPCFENKVLEIRTSTIPTLANHVAFQCAEGNFTDVDVIVGQRTFKGHKVILSRVPFFAASFKSGFAEQHSGTVRLPDVKQEVFEVVWKAIYSDDESSVKGLQDASLLRGVVELAHRLEMTHLKDRAARRLAEALANQLVADEAASWLAFSQQYGARRLEEHCLRFIETHGAEVLMAEAGRDWSANLSAYRCIVDAAVRKRRGLNGP